MEELLAQSPLFQGIPPEALTQVAAFCRMEKFRDGDILIVERDTASDDIFLMVEGEVEVVINAMDYVYEGRQILVAAPQMRVFGDFACLLSMPRMATVRAVGDIQVIRLHGDRFRAFLEANPVWGYRVLINMMGLMVQRLHGANSLIKRHFY